MASRKEQKEEARRAREAAEAAAAAKVAQQRRIMALAGVGIVAVVIIGVVIAIVATNGSSTKKNVAAATQTTSTTAKNNIKAVTTELAGIPQSGTTLGNPNAKVTLTYFGDLQCPVCQAFSLGESGGGLPQFIAGPVKAGTVKVVYRSLCTATECPNNQQTFNDQQVAAYAAGKQGKAWDYIELFYRDQGEEASGYVTNAFLTGLAKQIPGLNLAEWNKDRKDPSLLAQVQADASTANKDQLSSTPSVIMSGPKTETLVDNGSIPTFSDMSKAITQVS